MDVPADIRSDPLRQVTASRLFDAVVAARGPVSSTELAARVGVHPNSARLHLGRLHDAGLIDLGSEHGARGRPRQTWTVSPGAEIDGRPPDAYRELATWLTRTVPGPRAVADEGRRIGAEIGAGAGDGERDCADTLGSALASMGFQPRRSDSGTKTAFTLCNCPYREAATADPGIVCSLHRGVVDGLISAVDAGMELTRFEIEDPTEAGCRIEIDRRRPPTPTEVSNVR